MTQDRLMAASVFVFFSGLQVEVMEEPLVMFMVAC